MFIWQHEQRMKWVVLLSSLAFRVRVVCAVVFAQYDR